MSEDMQRQSHETTRPLQVAAVQSDVSMGPPSTREHQDELMSQPDPDLCAQIQDGDPLASEMLVRRHHGFIRNTAVKAWLKRDQPVGADVDDLMQEGFLALLHSANSAERRDDSKFLTYAGVAVKHKIAKHLDDMESTVRVPVYTRPKLREIHAVNSKRIAQQQPLLNEAEISRMCDVPVGGPGFRTGDYIATGTLLRSILITRYMGSIDNGYSPARDTTPVNDYVLDERNAVTSVTTEPELPADEVTESSVMHEQLREALEISLSTLSERDRKVLTLRFGLDGKSPRTLEETGRELGFTCEWVRQIESKALSSLRHPSRTRSLWQFLN